MHSHVLLGCHVIQYLKYFTQVTVVKAQTENTLLSTTRQGGYDVNTDYLIQYLNSTLKLRSYVSTFVRAQIFKMENVDFVKV